MKLGVVGAGMIVHSFLPEILQTEGVEVVALYARRPEAARSLCEKYGIDGSCTTFDELCRSGIDTVYVAVSNIAHYDYCRACLERGLNVIVEKPITAHYQQALELQTLAESRGLFLFEAITTLHIGTYQKVRQWLPRIGEIRNAESIFTQRSSRLDAFLAGQIQPAFDPMQAGGCLMDLNVYNLHYIMGLFGPPEKTVYYPNIQRGIDTSGRMILRYPGFTAHCFAAKDCGGYSGSLIQGSDGWIKTTLSPNLVGEAILHLKDGTEEHFDDKSGLIRAATEFRVFADAIAREDHAFCRALLEKSIAVCKVMTDARLAAGIRFPCD